MQTYYHWAKPQDRSSIFALGLLPYHPQTGKSSAEEIRNRAGAAVYAYRSLEKGREWPLYDCWKIVSEHYWMDDPLRYEMGGSTVCYHRAIPVGQIEYMGFFDPKLRVLVMPKNFTPELSPA